MWRGAVAYRVAVVLVAGSIGVLSALKMGTWFPGFGPQGVVFGAVAFGAAAGVLAAYMERTLLLFAGMGLGFVLTDLFVDHTLWCVAGGVCGALVLSLWFEALLRVITAATGALLMLAALGQSSPMVWAAFAAAGMAVQAGIGRKEAESE